MKTILFAAVLTASSMAIAQTTEEQPADTDAAVEAVQPTEPAATVPPVPPVASTAQTVAPGNQAPERDARGIPVISDPATAPAGANQPLNVPAGATVVPDPNQRAAFASQPASEDYPTCSKTVTDNCVQSYERGRAR